MALVRTRSRGEARVGEGDHRWLTFAVAALAVAALVLWLDRDMTPFHDELWFLCGRSLTDLGSLLAPHNEHFVAVHAAAYLGLAGIFGTSSSLPFLAVLLALHAAVAGAVFRLTGSPLAAGAMLAFGAGFENLFWGFQIGLVGGLALGLWSLVAFHERRPGWGAALLTLAVATAGTALVVVPAIGIILVAERRYRHIAWMMPAGLVYGAWYLLEHDAIAFRGDAPTVAGVLSYLGSGLVASLGFGAGAFMAVVVALLVLAALPRQITPVAWAGIAGLVSTFLVLGLMRQGFAPAASSRYVYVAAPFLLLAIGAMTAARPVFIRVALVGAIGVGSVLLVSHGRAWPTYVAATRAAGADNPPPGCLHY